MPGLRIQHPTARNVRFTVVQGDRPYGKPFTCAPPEFGGCGSTHLFKTWHLNLDGTGSVILSSEGYDLIKPILMLNGFRVTNTVKKPPTQGIGMAPLVAGSGAWGSIPIIVGKEM